MPTIKNIIIFLVIGAAFVFIYFYFIRPAPDKATLVSSSPNSLPLNMTNTANTTGLPGDVSLVTQDFLRLLLSVKNVKLNDAIFSDVAFTGLRDSSIVLVPDGNEGRINPFAPLGTDNVALPANNTSTAGQTGSVGPTTGPSTSP